jgi:hypothetical protein
VSNQPPPPWGDQSGGNPPTQPLPPQGQPGGFGGPPPGFGGPPGGFGGHPPGGPPGGFGGPPPGGGYGGPPGGGYGGPPGFGAGGYPPGGPQKSKAPLIVGIIAAVLILGGGAGAFFLLSGDDDPDVAVGTPSPTEADTPTAAESDEPSDEPTEDPTDAPTPTPRPTATQPAAPPTAPPLPTTTPPSPPPATGGGGDEMAMNEGITGEITAETPTQDFTLEGFAGEEVVLTLLAIDESLDPVLTLFGPDGTELGRNDDVSPGTDTNSRLQVTLPVDGTYRVEASSFAGTTGRFELTLSFPSVLSATDTLSDAVPEIGYDYTGVAGQTLVIDMRGLDEDIDPLVYVEDASGNEIGRDDDSGAAPLDSRLEITLPADGTYTIVAAAFSERYGMFELTVTEL